MITDCAQARSAHLFLGLPGLFFEVIFGYVTALAPSYEVFAVSRLLVGLMNGGIGLVCFVLTQEYVGKSYWAMTGTKHPSVLPSVPRLSFHLLIIWLGWKE